MVAGLVALLACGGLHVVQPPPPPLTTVSTHDAAPPRARMMVIASRMALEEGDRLRARADLEEAIRHDPGSAWLKLRRLEFLSLEELEAELPAWAEAAPELRLRAALVHARRLSEAGQTEAANRELAAALALARQTGELAPDCHRTCAEAWIAKWLHLYAPRPKK